MANPVPTKLGSNTSGPSGSTNTLVLTLSVGNTSGDINVLAAQGNAPGSVTITDSKSNTWQVDGSRTTTNRRIFLCSSKPSSLLTNTDTVTITYDSNCTDRSGVVYGTTHLNQTTWFTSGNVASTTGTSTTPDSGNISGLTSGNNYWLFGICGYNNGGSTFSAGNDGHSNNYTKLDELSNSSAFRLATEHSASLTGQTTYKATGTITSSSWSMLVGAYNVAASSQTVTLTQPTETDSSAAFVHPKALHLTQPSETDSSAAITHGQLRILGQATETDSAFAHSWAPKKRLVNQATETDSSAVITPSLAGSGGFPTSYSEPKGNSNARSTYLDGGSGSPGPQDADIGDLYIIFCGQPDGEIRSITIGSDELTRIAHYESWTTNLTIGASPSDTSVFVDDASEFEIGQRIVIDPDAVGTNDIVEITDIDPFFNIVSFTPGLANSYGSGVTVTNGMSYALFAGKFTEYYGPDELIVFDADYSISTTDPGLGYEGYWFSYSGGDIDVEDLISSVNNELGEATILDTEESFNCIWLSIVVGDLGPWDSLSPGLYLHNPNDGRWDSGSGWSDGVTQDQFTAWGYYGTNGVRSASSIVVLPLSEGTTFDAPISLPILDDFNRGDDVTLGSDWSYDVSLGVQDNQVVVEETASSIDDSVAYSGTGAPETPDQGAGITILADLPTSVSNPGGDASRIGVTLRGIQVSGPCDEAYICVLERDINDELIYLVIYWGGPSGWSYTQIGDKILVDGIIPGVSLLYAKVVGETITAYYTYNGDWSDTVTTSGSDSYYTDTGFIGISTNRYSIDSIVADNFVGGDVVETGTIGIDQVNETDSAGVFVRLKKTTLNQASEIDTAQTTVPLRIHILTQVNETDSSNAFTYYKTLHLTQVTETDTAQTVTPKRIYLLTQITETDSALTITPRRTLAIGQSTETDIANAFTNYKTLHLTQSSEIDSATTFIIKKIRSITQVIETDSANAFTHAGATTLTLVTEIDSAFSSTPVRVLGIGGPANETDIANAFTHYKTVLLGQSSETNTANTFSAHKYKTLTLTSETDTANQVTPLRVWSTGQATETDTAFPAAHTRSLRAAQALETDSADSVGHGLLRALSVATETDSAFTYVIPKRRLIAQSIETDTATSFSTSRFVSIIQSIESDTANAFTILKKKSLGLSNETDTTTAFGHYKTKQLTLVTEIDTANTFSIHKYSYLTQVSELDTATSFTKNRLRTLGQSLETDRAFLIGEVSILLQLVTENDLAHTVTPRVYGYSQHTAKGNLVMTTQAEGIIRKISAGGLLIKSPAQGRLIHE